MLKLAKYVDFFESLDNANDLAACQPIIFKEFEKLDVPSIYYGCASHADDFVRGDINQAIHGLSNHPDKWFEEYGADGCLDNDLTAHVCANSNDLVVWHDNELWDNASNAEKEQVAFELELGMNVGVTMPLHNFGQRNVAMIGISLTDMKPQEFDRFWQEKGTDITELSHVLNLVIQNRFMVELCKNINLTRRCRDFLKFSALGNNYKEIAIKMGISLATVNQIAKQVVKQLNARNIVHAVYKATTLNLIEI